MRLFVAAAIVAMIAFLFFVREESHNVVPERESPENVSMTTPAVSEPVFAETDERDVEEDTQSESHRVDSGEILRIENVPFIVQAPNGNWKEPLFQDGCEEASMLMVMGWQSGQLALSSETAIQKMRELAKWEEKRYGTSRDLSAKDVADTLRTYAGSERAMVSDGVTADTIRDALAQGNLIIVPTDGRKLGNPFFTSPGPERHMLVIIGHDPHEDVFVVHDPGTRRGAQYRYATRTLLAAIRDYPSGDHLSIRDTIPRMVIVSKDTIKGAILSE